MQELRNRVLDIVKREGPLLPVAIARKVERDTLFTSAILSELLSRKEILLTRGKIGGSPLYYSRGQEPRIQKLYSYLGEKPKKAFSLLKEKKVLQDSKCEPWQRVALREIQDFAKPIEVQGSDRKELFWRWYMINNEEAEKVIKEMYDKPKEVKTVASQKKEIKKSEGKPEIKEKKEEKPKEMKKFDDAGLVLEARNYFNKNNIEILEEEIVRKNTEYDYIVKIPSQIGTMAYFAKVKSKKKVNEGDLSLARDKGRDNKLPVLFLTKGELTKKAKDYLEKNLKGYLIVRRLS